MRGVLTTRDVALATATVAAGCFGATGATASARCGAGAGEGEGCCATTSVASGSSIESSVSAPTAKRLSPSADRTCAASALSSAIVSAVATGESLSHPANENAATSTVRLLKGPDIRGAPSLDDRSMISLPQSCHPDVQSIVTAPSRVPPFDSFRTSRRPRYTVHRRSRPTRGHFRFPLVS